MILLAGGLGTRLRPFSDQVPKPYLPVLGVPAIQLVLDGLAGIRKAAINVHHLPSVALEAIRGLDRGSVELVVSDESARLLGSGGGIRRAAALLEGDRFFVLNADVLQAPDLQALASRHLEPTRGSRVSITLLLSRKGPRGAKYREIRTDAAEARISGLGELAEGGCFFTGTSVVERSTLARLPEGCSDFVDHLLLPAIEEGRAGCLVTDDPLWIDLGSAELWWRAHFTLMEAWEARRLPDPWMRRIASAARCLEPGIWLGAGDAVPPARLAPRVFVSGATQLPAAVGPDVVIYGPAARESLTSGIGFGGSWVPCSG